MQALEDLDAGGACGVDVEVAAGEASLVGAFELIRMLEGDPPVAPIIVLHGTGGRHDARHVDVAPPRLATMSDTRAGLGSLKISRGVGKSNIEHGASHCGSSPTHPRLPC